MATPFKGASAKRSRDAAEASRNKAAINEAARNKAAINEAALNEAAPT